MRAGTEVCQRHVYGNPGKDAAPREVLDYIREHGLEEHFCFVTDDVMADTLCIQGHLDALVPRGHGTGDAGRAGSL